MSKHEFGLGGVGFTAAFFLLLTTFFEVLLVFFAHVTDSNSLRFIGVGAVRGVSILSLVSSHALVF
jgi:hypothetical protein